MKFTKRGLQLSQAGENKSTPKKKPRRKVAVLPNGKEMNYHEYIISPEWRSRHMEFLTRGKFRCAFMPWLTIGKKKRYACHHMSYENLGQEIYSVDVIILHPWIHRFIVHGILSRFKSAGKQKTAYPNKAQKVFHGFCKLPYSLKMAVWLIAIAVAFVPPVWLLAYFRPDLGLAFAIALGLYALFQFKK